MSNPTFGEKEEGQDYTSRFAAYVVIQHPETKQLSLVQAPNGAYFLPGGEIEGRETKEEALDREMLEELGAVIQVGGYLGQADEYFYSRHRDTYYYNPGYFYWAESWQQVGEPTEKTNQLAWAEPEEAMVLLKRGSHKWAVAEWLKQA